jgi:cadmium resistance protein CadD (predicted permease)
MKSIIDRADYIMCAALIIIGASLVVLAFFNSPVQLQFTVGLAGLGFICLGLLQLKKVRENDENLEKIELINNKLEEIKREIEKKEKAKGTGVAVADIISSGLKYYSEHINKAKNED